MSDDEDHDDDDHNNNTQQPDCQQDCQRGLSTGLSTTHNDTTNTNSGNTRPSKTGLPLLLCALINGQPRHLSMTPPESPPRPLAGARESSSSKNNTQGAANRACANTSRTFRSDSPTYMSRSWGGKGSHKQKGQKWRGGGGVGGSEGTLNR